jgi:transcriptional regulator with XRE-family HTH domain
MRTMTVGQSIGKQVSRARQRRGWTQQRLADAIRAHDKTSKLGRGAVAKIENGERKVSVDEWLLLSAALNVPPVLLLLPLGSEDVVEITPRSRIHPQLALDWLMGNEALVDSKRFVIDRGAWLRNAEPLFLWEALGDAQQAVHHASAAIKRAEYRGDDDRTRQAKQTYAEALEALHAHLLRMQTAGERLPRLRPSTLAEMEAVGLDVTDLPVWEPGEAE